MKRSPVTNYPSAFSLLCKKLNLMSAVFSTSTVRCTPVSGRAIVGVQKGVPWAMRTEELVTLEEVRDGRRGEELVWGEGEEPRGEINGWWLPAGGWWAGDTCSSEGLVPLLLGSWPQRFVSAPARGQTWLS